MSQVNGIYGYDDFRKPLERNKFGTVVDGKLVNPATTTSVVLFHHFPSQPDMVYGLLQEMGITISGIVSEILSGANKSDEWDAIVPLLGWINAEMPDELLPLKQESINRIRLEIERLASEMDPGTHLMLLDSSSLVLHKDSAGNVTIGDRFATFHEMTCDAYYQMSIGGHEMYVLIEAPNGLVELEAEEVNESGLPVHEASA